MDTWLFIGYVVAMCWQQWQIGDLQGRLDYHREIMRKLVEAVNGELEEP